ncbi:hypothetical protein FD16_GL001602 [Paucilactobacillus suebicus DSM 5007 = KCTC 3549]|uniref:Uncharacterized protein n=1 Tax=Paucilactobacillus suebicus DSM 5007 = KCTC 3549 TaxID=1423807 RepID=A0A0R1W182_9LACO|nr:hypothetical protein FD16_GL001602 [Paucilactobacillus suebicus DSM 5007 = KCTC 3549]
MIPVIISTTAVGKAEILNRAIISGISNAANKTITSEKLSMSRPLWNFEITFLQSIL